MACCTPVRACVRACVRVRCSKRLPTSKRYELATFMGFHRPPSFPKKPHPCQDCRYCILNSNISPTILLSTRTLLHGRFPQGEAYMHETRGGHGGSTEAQPFYQKLDKLFANLSSANWPVYLLLQASHCYSTLQPE